MLRSAASSLLSLLILVTFMWGGCVSCEQYFMFPGRHQSCCNKSGQCERPGQNQSKPEKQDCNRLPLQRGDHAQTLPLPAVLPTPGRAAGSVARQSPKTAPDPLDGRNGGRRAERDQPQSDTAPTSRRQMVRQEESDSGRERSSRRNDKSKLGERQCHGPHFTPR